MKKRVIIILVSLMFSVVLSAQERTRWVEIGEGTFDYGFVFPYKIKFFVPYGVRNIDDIKEGLLPMKFKLNWLPIEYQKEQVKKLFNKQIEDNYSSAESFQLSYNLIQYFLNKLPEIKKHDEWTFIYYPDEGTKLFIKDKKIHHLVGSEFNRALVQSWLNKNPVLTSNLFKRLLKIQ